MTVKVVRVVQTCGMHPSQWEGETDKGEFVYARYRGGLMRVDVAPTEAEWVSHPFQNFTVFSKDHGDSHDGYMSYAELKQHTAGVVEWPEQQEEC